jgi:hypothetical protein
MNCDTYDLAMNILRDQLLFSQLGITSSLLYTYYVIGRNQDVLLSNDGNCKLKLNIVDRNPNRWGDSVEPNRYYKLVNNNEWVPIEVI